jgi:stress-induced morphogen
MSFTYTSADLAKIDATIPGRAASADLLIVPGVEVKKEIDVEVDSEVADIEAALKLAVLVGAPFISVSTTPFSVDMTRIYFETEHGEELPPAAERILKAADKRDGTMMSLTVNWIAQGLAYEWCARCDWAGELMQKVNAVLENAEVESEAEREEHREQYRAAYQASLSALLNSPKYRGESIGKRRHLVKSILAEAGVEEMPEVFMTRQVQPEANRIIGEKVYEYEQDFRARKTELADELRTYPAWQRVYTQIQRKAAAAEFLKEKADCYRLSTDLASEISEAAAKPVYVSRY